MAHMGKVSRLPSDEQVRMREIHAEKPLTFQAVSHARPFLPRFQRMLAHEFRAKLLTLTIDASARLENLKRRIRR